ncbi:MAG: SixA phosphatase family protein [Acidimicrobiales bacterium]
MKQTWVLRHAKAVPHRPDDHARPLAPRGRRQCAQLAAELEAMAAGERPGLVLSSSAARARETAELVMAGLPGARLEVEDALYQADADDIVERLRRLDDELDSVVVVGHNPTLEYLVELLVDKDDADGHERLAHGLGTCALAVVSFAEADRWSQVVPGAGRLVRLLAPTGRD